jgi:hypothetical protein
MLLNEAQLIQGDALLDFRYKCYVRLARLVREAYTTLFAHEWFYSRLFTEYPSVRFRNEVDPFWAHVQMVERTGGAGQANLASETQWYNLTLIADAFLELLEAYVPGWRQKALKGDESRLQADLIQRTEALIEEMKPQ